MGPPRVSPLAQSGFVDPQNEQNEQNRLQERENQ